MSYLIAGLLGPIFWLVTLSVALWLVRKFVPSWEKVLFMKIPMDDPRENQPDQSRTSQPVRGPFCYPKGPRLRD